MYRPRPDKPDGVASALGPVPFWYVLRPQYRDIPLGFSEEDCRTAAHRWAMWALKRRGDRPIPVSVLVAEVEQASIYLDDEPQGEYEPGLPVPILKDIDPTVLIPRGAMQTRQQALQTTEYHTNQMMAKLKFEELTFLYERAITSERRVLTVVNTALHGRTTREQQEAAAEADDLFLGEANEEAFPTKEQFQAMWMTHRRWNSVAYKPMEVGGVISMVAEVEFVVLPDRLRVDSINVTDLETAVMGHNVASILTGLRHDFSDLEG